MRTSPKFLLCAVLILLAGVPLAVVASTFDHAQRPTVTADPVMMPWVIPQGVHTFNSPLVIENMDGVTWRGYGSSKGTKLVYTGPPTKAFIQLIGSSRCKLSDFDIVIASPGVDAAILVTNKPAGTEGRVSTGHVFDRLRILHDGKPTAATRGFSVDSYAMGGVDGNNDLHQFINCQVQSYTESGYYVRGSQCHDLYFRGCTAHDHGGRKPVGFHAADGVFFTWHRGVMTNNSVDFKLGSAEVQTVIDGHNSEHGQQFLTYPSSSGTPFVNISNVRWEGSPVAGKPVIDVAGGGPWTIRNAMFSGVSGLCPMFRFTGSGIGSVDLSGIMIRQHGGTVPLWPLMACPTTFDLRTNGLRHQFIDATGRRTDSKITVNSLTVQEVRH